LSANAKGMRSRAQSRKSVLGFARRGRFLMGASVWREENGVVKGIILVGFMVSVRGCRRVVWGRGSTLTGRNARIEEKVSKR
jgi:hypothetical protein